MKIKSIIAIMCITIAGSASAQLKYPATRTDASVVDDYFGMKVADPYRWLEDDNSAETAEWVKAQNAVTGAYLQKIPFRNASPAFSPTSAAVHPSSATANTTSTATTDSRTRLCSTSKLHSPLSR